MKRPDNRPAVSRFLQSVSTLHAALGAAILAQGITPTMSAPMNANAQHTINALIGFVSPMS
jgi:hypothetical protein